MGLMNSLQGDLDETQAQFALEKQKVVDAFIENEKTKHELQSVCAERLHQLPSSESNSQIKCDALEAEIAELQQLLASTNKLEEEARSNAIIADEELAQKESEYEEIMKFASERDAAAQAAEEKVNTLEGRLSSDCNDEEEQLLKDMELLMDEKLEVEARLDKE